MGLTVRDAFGDKGCSDLGPEGVDQRERIFFFEARELFVRHFELSFSISLTDLSGMRSRVAVVGLFNPIRDLPVFERSRRSEDRHVLIVRVEVSLNRTAAIERSRQLEL